MLFTFILSGLMSAIVPRPTEWKKLIIIDKKSSEKMVEGFKADQYWVLIRFLSGA
jgi:hypothetical protein